jgi:hypothetical protein
MEKEEFEFQKELLKLEAKNDEKKHKFHMKELEYQMELEKVKFDYQCQIQRIRSSEIRKTIERKQGFN